MPASSGYAVASRALTPDELFLLREEDRFIEWFDGTDQDPSTYEVARRAWMARAEMVDVRLNPPKEERANEGVNGDTATQHEVRFARTFNIDPVKQRQMLEQLEMARQHDLQRQRNPGGGFEFLEARIREDQERRRMLEEERMRALKEMGFFAPPPTVKIRKDKNKDAVQRAIERQERLRQEEIERNRQITRQLEEQAQRQLQEELAKRLLDANVKIRDTRASTLGKDSDPFDKLRKEGRL